MIMTLMNCGEDYLFLTAGMRRRNFKCMKAFLVKYCGRRATCFNGNLAILFCPEKPDDGL